MKYIEKIQDLPHEVLNWRGNDWVYVNHQKWEASPCDAHFLIISEDELAELEEQDLYVENEAGESIPIQYADEDFSRWLESQTLKAIFVNARISESFASIEFLVDCVNHYLEYDDFMN